MFRVKEISFEYNILKGICPACGHDLKCMRKDFYVYLFDIRLYRKGTEEFYKCVACMGIFKPKEVYFHTIDENSRIGLS